jgi:putative ABC transport system substrate-binding protein
MPAFLPTSTTPLGRRAGCVAWLAALVLLVLQPAAASGNVVAVIKSGSLTPFERATGAIVEALKKSIPQPEILTFDLEGDEANAPAILARVHRANPSVVVTVGSLATTVALADPSALPVVFSMVLYPEQSGFLKKTSHHVTGASLDIPPEAQFGYLRRLLPAARRVGVLFNPDETGSIVDKARAAAPHHGFTLVDRPVDAEGDAVGALGELMEKVDVVWAVADSHVFTPQTTLGLILASLRRRVPVIGLSTAHVRAGALAALYCDYEDVGRQTADLALRVLHGEDASNVPVASPRKVALALNLHTADHLGVKVAPDVIAEAGETVR